VVTVSNLMLYILPSTVSSHPSYPYYMAQALIQVSVRELVDFALRSGNLGAPFVTATRAVEGTRGHQLIQQNWPPEQEAEVPVTFVYTAEPFSLRISGRVDGLLYQHRELLVEEIKTTYGALDPAAADNPLHWAQAKIYAYILAVERNLERVEIQLTYVQLKSGQVLEKRRPFTIDELTEFFESIVTRYLQWARIYREWCGERDRSIEHLQFPFDTYRQGQEDLCAAVYETLETRGRLFAEAPTGIGKTISVLFPAVRALSSLKVEKVFYLTAKTSGRAVAEKALDDMRAKSGLKLKSITLTARDRICFNARDGRPCDTDTCEYAIGYYDRINDAIEDLFRKNAFTRTAIEAAGRAHRVCPFELSLDLSLWADVIICDYNYVFDPKAYLRRYFLDTTGDYAFLVDEAHNLVERAREMYSAQLDKRQVLSVKRGVLAAHPALARTLEAINTYLLALSRLCESDGDGTGWADREPPEKLLPLLDQFVRAAEVILARNRPAPYREELTDLFFAVVGFIRIADVFDEHYVTHAQKHGRGLRLRLFCLDPSAQLARALKRGKTAVFFSATLTPVEYFRDLLGGERADFTLELQSPFPRENLAFLIADRIDTTYRRRADSYGDIADSVAAATGQRRGNYMVYFPSYRYLEEVYARFHTGHPQVRTLAQRSGMTEPEREAFLTVFDAVNRETVIGFAVMGGIFGEGIDLMGERLVGAIVVGVGLPQICLERNLIRNYYDDRDAAGFAYAYTFPGMNRVLQAAGRVIRSSDDRGLVLLIDRRFGQETYRRLLPVHLENPEITRRPDEIGQAVAAFWSRADNAEPTGS